MIKLHIWYIHSESETSEMHQTHRADPICMCPTELTHGPGNALHPTDSWEVSCHYLYSIRGIHTLALLHSVKQCSTSTPSLVQTVQINNIQSSS